MIPSPGETFHGRDVFAPAAALIAAGDATLEDLGPLVDGDSVQIPRLEEVGPCPIPGVDGERRRLRDRDAQSG